MNDTNKERAGLFTKKPVTIDAWLIDPANKPHPAWVHNAFAGGDINWCPAGNGLYINTLEGHMLGGHGDYLIRGVQGELYACKAHIFAATYEPEARASLAANAPAAPTQASPDGWKWMTHPSRNGGLPIPVRVFAEDGVTYYQPFSEADCEFEWESRDSEWHEAAPPAPTEQWMPIETAPEDGSRLILTDGAKVFRGGFAKVEFKEHRDPDAYWLNFEDGDVCHPTHWQPEPALPAPPQGAANKDES